MRFELENLPSDTVLLHRLVRDMAIVVDSRDGEIERLQLIIKKLQRAQFGRRSERLDADQLALALEDLDGDIARIRESRRIVIAETDNSRRRMAGRRAGSATGFRPGPSPPVSVPLARLVRTVAMGSPPHLPRSHDR
jgi:transposase IS166 family protein